MTHRQRKLNRKYWVITPSCVITTYGRKASLRYPYGSIGKSGFLKRIKKPSVGRR